MRYVIFVLVIVCSFTASADTATSMAGKIWGESIADGAWREFKKHPCRHLDEYLSSLADAVHELFGPDLKDRPKDFREAAAGELLHAIQKRSDQCLASNTPKIGAVRADSRQSLLYQNGVNIGIAKIRYQWTKLGTKPPARCPNLGKLREFRDREQKKYARRHPSFVYGLKVGTNRAYRVLATSCSKKNDPVTQGGDAITGNEDRYPMDDSPTDIANPRHSKGANQGVRVHIFSSWDELSKTRYGLEDFPAMIKEMLDGFLEDAEREQGGPHSQRYRALLQEVVAGAYAGIDDIAKACGRDDRCLRDVDSYKKAVKDWERLHLPLTDAPANRGTPAAPARRGGWFQWYSS